MRKVVSQSEVAHLFANQLQSEARNQTDTFYFYGKKIYSYGSHFCIAKFMEDGTLLFTERSYSNTTSKHVSNVWHATNHKSRILCAHPDGSHTENFDFWLNEAEFQIGKLKNARKPQIYLNNLDGIHHKVQKYATYFGIEVPITLSKALHVNNKEKFAQYEDDKKEWIEAEKKRKEAEAKKLHTKSLKKWRKFESNRLYLRDGWDYLRKTETDFETSQGVKFPIAVGMRFFQNIKEGNVRAGDKFLDFQVKKVTKTYIVIGCHRVKFNEVK